MSLAAIDAGKHVLCEKPFALNAAEAREMRDAAASAGLTAMVAHEFRYAPQRSSSGSCSTRATSARPSVVTIELFLGRASSAAIPPMAWGALAANGGGFLGGLGSHFIDGLRHWFGDVASASGSLRTLRPDRLDADGNVVKADADDTFACTLTFRNGVVATMNASSAVAPGQGARILVGGSEGRALRHAARPEPRAGRRRARREVDGARTGRAADARAVHRESTTRATTAWPRSACSSASSSAASARAPAVIPSFEDGLRCQEVLDAVRESSRTGRVVAIGE